MAAERLNATAGSLLGFLHSGPQSGWDLVQTAQIQIGDFWSLTQSQVYRELTAMAQAGLIQAEATGSRDRRAYRLTKAGRTAFAAWLKQLPGAEQIRYPLLLTLTFARHLPAKEIDAFVAHHRGIHADRLEAYRQAEVAARAAGATAADLVTLDFGIRYETAVLGWFDNLPDAGQLRRR